jgi:predicted flap endonuclease-1-like 5' DNA nuclease
MRRIVVRATYRVVRAFAGFALLALSVGWLLRRRRAATGPPATDRRLTVVPPVSGLDEPVPAEPRAPEPLTAVGRPVHDAATTDEPTAATESPVDDAADEPLAALPADEPLAALPADEPLAAEPGTGPTGGPNADAVAQSPNGLSVVPADDLREIRGIGPATESALHDLGIHTYQQLAVLDAEGAERLRVALKDTQRRIERQDWVRQAAELHRAKYGGDPLRPV